jgi:hypothetical protein
MFGASGEGLILVGPDGALSSLIVMKGIYILKAIATVVV